MAVLSDLTSSTARYRVFISYSHDSEDHRKRVKNLADSIGVAEDTDCVLDQYVPGEHPIEGWPRWMEQQFDIATRVLCVCTPRYLQLLKNDPAIKRTEGRGAHWESELFLAELYREKSTSKKLKALVLANSDPDECVPAWLTKWGWLAFPQSKADPAYKRLISFVADSAPAPGAGLPESVDIKAGLNAEQREFIRWIRSDTVRSVENVKVLGMSKPIKLLSIYYPVVLSTTIARRLYESQWKKAVTNGDEKKEITGARRKHSLASFVVGSEFVDNNQLVVVLGGPGAGKTTFLRSLALKYCGSVTHLDEEEGFAVFIHLPTFSKSEVSFLDWIDDQIGLCEPRYRGMLRSLGTQVRVAILLDSLDEVPAGARASVLDRVKTLERQLPSARVVLSCRTADYQESLENFSDVEIARLSSDAIAKIVPAWFPENPEIGVRLLALMAADEGVRALTETPLLLSLLCIQFRHDLDLPKRRVELYERCVSVLLREWDSERKFRRESSFERLTEARRIKLFEHVAGYFMLNRGRYDLPDNEMHQVVGEYIEKCGVPPEEASGVLREIESLHGLIERLSRDHYCFSHNTLQDYFTACRIVASRLETKLVLEHVGDESWAPIIEFIAAILDEPWPVFEILMKSSDMDGLSNYPAMARRTRVLTLLYRCLCVSPLLTGKQRASVVDHIIRSHAHMAKIYGNGGVYPFATMRREGVTHTYLWTRKRPTLAEALKPFRQLSNLIYLSPAKEYCEAVLRYVDSEVGPSLEGLASERVSSPFLRETLTVSLLVPISSENPVAVTERLEALANVTKAPFVGNSIRESVRLIRAKFASTGA